MKIKLLFSLFFLFIFINKITFSQCCGAGSPVAGDADQKGMRKKSWKVFLFYKYSFSDSYYKGENKLNLPSTAGLIKSSDFNYSEFNAIYGITNKLSVHANIGYYLNKSADYKNNIFKIQSGQGLADASLVFKYTMYNNISNKFDITSGLGIKLPVGVFGQQKDGIILPISLQPSSGSYKYIGNILIFKGFMDGKLNFLSFNSIEVATKIYSDFFKNFKYGNLYINSFFLNYFFKQKFAGIIQLRNECREKETEDGVKNAESGNNVLYFAPAINYKFLKSFNITASFDIPIYRKYNGIQMGNKYSFSLRLAKDFGLCK